MICTALIEPVHIATVKSKKINKTSGIEATVLNSLLPISKKEIADILPDVSVTIIEAVVSKMSKEEMIIKIGEGMNTKCLRKK